MPEPDREPAVRRPFHGMLLIGAESRKSGKTDFTCAVISRFRGEHPIVGLKVTAIRGDGQACARGGAGCGACDLDQPWCLTEETDPDTGKDTSRMLKSGASRVFWARCREGAIRACIDAFRARIPSGTLVVAESNGLAAVADPDLFLMLRERGGAGAKASALSVLGYADRVILSDRGGFEPGPEALSVLDGRWQLLDASAVVLAGGASVRMGREKSLLPVGGVPLIQRVLDQLQGRFREVLISAEEPGRFGFTGLRVITDPRPGQGPLVGIAAALEAARGDTVFVVACDIPVIDPGVLRRLLAASREADCAVPRRFDGRWEPLFSVWRRSALPAIRQVLATSHRKIDAVFPLIRMAVVEIGEAPWLHNLNTPEDVRTFLTPHSPPRRAGRDGPRPEI